MSQLSLNIYRSAFDRVALGNVKPSTTMRTMMLKKLSLNVRLLSLICFLVLICIGVGTMTLRSTHDIVKEYNTVVTANLPNIQKLGLMRYESQNFVRNVIKLSVPGNSQK